MKTNRHVPFSIGIVCLIAAYFLLTQLSSIIYTVLGALALGGAFNGIKDAITLTDDEIKDVTKF